MLVELSKITISEGRQRKLFLEVDMDYFEKDIEENGLLHAIGLKEDGSLLYGERRLRAVRALAKAGKQIKYAGELVTLGFIPAIKLEQLSPLKEREIEFAENEQRVQLNWKERAAAIAQLHELRQMQAKERGSSHTIKDTAKEIGIPGAFAEVKEDLILSKFTNDPVIAKAKSKPEALKLVRKKLQNEHREKLAREFDIKKLATPHNIIPGDLFEVLPQLEPQFDCIVADPPYGMNADTFVMMRGATPTYTDDWEYASAVLRCIAHEGMRVTLEKAHCYVFCDIDQFKAVRAIFEAAGWYCWKTPLIWYKGNVGVAPWPSHGPRRVYEAVLYCIKGNKETVCLKTDCAYIPGEKLSDEEGRGSYKPYEIYAEWLSRSINPGDKVLDPCCGTGPIFLAAAQLRAIATGIEIDPTAVAVCYKRLERLAALDSNF